jgi:hypothetical protein
MNTTSVNESDRLRFVLAGLRSAGVSMMYQDTDLVIRFSANLPETWALGDDLEGGTDEAVFSPQYVEKVLSAKRGVITNAQPTKIESCVTSIMSGTGTCSISSRTSTRRTT